jgi:threonylcarbamoyladenosine tRNA methylthiotransferase MtaB
MKIYLDTVGCRLNQSEIEIMARQFRVAGHEIVGDVSKADLVVINTCTVTTQAASDSRQKVRQAVRQGAGEIILTGCWSTMEPEQAKNLPHVQRIIPNDRKEKMVSEILGTPVLAFEIEPLVRRPLPGLHRRTRAFIKVQDGCDNHCTYCITTLARGKAISRNIKDVINDIQFALKGGSQEVVLTGVHLGSWGQENKEKSENLRDLVQTILDETEVPRLRLSSLEPWDLNEKFFELWENQRLCRHLHLPLQSGSEGVLRRMARKTSPIAYSDLLKSARKFIPEVAITTDLIVGFPGETDQEFQETMDFVERMSFSGGHVFTYSSRPGTVAARMAGQIPPEIRKLRNTRLRELLSKSRQAYTQRFIMKKLNVLWESTTQTETDGWRLDGLSDNYLNIRAFALEPRWNRIDNVILNSIKGEIVLGKIQFD